MNTSPPLPAFGMLNRYYNGKVQVDDGAGGGDGGGRGRWAGDVFANVGRANVRLLWRVTEAFSGDLSALIVTAQVCVFCRGY